MVGLGQSISHLQASLEYGNDSDKSAVLVLKRNIMATDIRDITKEFKLLHELNANCTRNMLSFVLSPTIKDGQRVVLKDWNKIVSEFIKEMGLNEHQSVAYLHQDKPHKHIHLYTSRIGFDGRAVSDSYIGGKSMKAAERVAKRLGLETTTEVREQKQSKTKEVRTEIFQLHKKVISEMVPEDLSSYISYMKAQGVYVIKSIDKFGNYRGCRIHYKEYNFKASEVHRQLSKNNLEKAFAKAQQLKSKNNDTIRKTGGITR
ncbi:relaxase/mobilization nuclease domain-containing protein [Dokdonia genika]|uniref:Relaxase/mobilization nuclease domain-containing protein n=1 Tax=Dokdonia genika TaxID=308113 RepID=A0ABV9LDW5_9FLAO|nr:relaxase/mobilization nuclease domain-containing protein [Dokdonia sp. MED134]EAQ40470.1 mobilization protein [Dokdonia sp. MED134]